MSTVADGGPSPLSRAAAGIAALAAALFLGAYEPLAFAQAGCAVSATVLAASAVPLVLILGAIALAPGLAQRFLSRFTRVDLRDNGHVGAFVIMAATVFFVVGWGGALTASVTIEQALGRCALGGAEPSLTGDAVLRGVTLNLAIFTLPAILYVAFVHGRGPVAALRDLGLRSEGAARAALIGSVAALAFVGILTLVEAAIQPYVPTEVLQNAKALEIAKGVTLAGAVALSAGSALGEEVFFRGYLQPRVGLLVTSLVFALAHFSYASVSEVAAAFLLALALGGLYRWTGNLWAPIAAHFVFNLVNLVAGIYS